MKESAEKVAEIAPEPTPGPRKFPDNPIDGFKHGAILDLRVRLAMEMVVHSPLVSESFVHHGRTAAQAATFALDVCTALFEEADARGLITDLDDPKMLTHLFGHVRRQVAFGIEQGKETQRQQTDAQRIATAVQGAFGGPRQ